MITCKQDPKDIKLRSKFHPIIGFHPDERMFRTAFRHIVLFYAIKPILFFYYCSFSYTRLDDKTRKISQRKK